MSLQNFPPENMKSSFKEGEDSPLLNHTISPQSSFVLKASKRETCKAFPLVCVILTVFFERVTYYSIVANLLLFLVGDLQMNSSYSILALFTFAGLSWLMSTVGGVIGDTVSGRYNAIWGSLLIYAYGTIILPVAAYINNNYDADHPKVFIITLVIIALFIVSVGEGAYKANIAAFGADQLSSHDETVYRKFFNYFYWSTNLGSLVAYSAVAYIQQIYGFFWGLLIPFASLFSALVTFSLPRMYYVVNPAVENYLKNIFGIVREARRRKKQHGESERYPGMEHVMPIRSWLDRAMIKYGGSYLDTEVEDVKSLGKILIIFVVLIPYWTIYFQMNSTFLLQGVHMKINMDKHENSKYENSKSIPASWLTLTDILFVIILIPIMDKFVYPALERRGIKMSVTARISIGLLFSVASMVVAGCLEFERNKAVREGKLSFQTINGKNYTAAKISVLWQIPQYGLIGLGEVFASIGGLEFAYREAPQSMHSFVMGLFYLVESIGGLLGAGLFAAVMEPGKEVKEETSHACLQNLKYYFFLLAGIVFLTWILFIFVSYRLRIPYSRNSPVLTRQSSVRRTYSRKEPSSYASSETVGFG